MLQGMYDYDYRLGYRSGTEDAESGRDESQQLSEDHEGPAYVSGYRAGQDAVDAEVLALLHHE